jgi:hypothetical protein
MARPQAKPRELWSTSDWARVRAPARHRDAELSGKALRWLEELPEHVRPLQLSVRYPRLANQLAACWGDVGLVEYLLEDLIIDRRGGRHGLPDEIVDEVALLYEFHELQRQGGDSSAEAWAASLRAS